MADRPSIWLEHERIRLTQDLGCVWVPVYSKLHQVSAVGSPPHPAHDCRQTGNVFFTSWSSSFIMLICFHHKHFLCFQWDSKWHINVKLNMSGYLELAKNLRVLNYKSHFQKEILFLKSSVIWSVAWIFIYLLQENCQAVQKQYSHNTVTNFLVILSAWRPSAETPVESVWP